MEKLKLNLFEIILGLSEALDLVSPIVANHHKRVAYIAGAIGQEIGLPEDIQRQLVLAGSVHDIGGLTVEERLSALKFEDELAKEHAEIGYCLLSIFEPLKPVAEIV
ncbi:MAG: HD domain-containing protein [Syntrophomonadaceae bacterium]|nr:HD domain-containing protein [Syntrophomonadaceae bacterium]